MTLLNKPFGRVNEDKIEIRKEEEDIKEPSSRLNPQIVEKSLWVVTFMVLFIVLGTGIYSILSIVESYSIEPLYAIERDDLNYLSISDELPIYEYDQEDGVADFSEVEALSIYAFNPITQQVYYQVDEKEVRSIASITKLLTVLVALDNFSLEDELVTSDIDLTKVEWKLGLESGDKISFKDALNALLITSYNDVAFVVADNHPNGVEGFVEEMNLKATAIGMENSNFENPAGLDGEGHYSNARDLKRLVHFALLEEEILSRVAQVEERITIQRYISEENYLAESVGLESTNQLLGNGDETMVGLKTGYTRDAGQSFIGYFKGEGDDQLITIILGANYDRFEETEQLVEVIRLSF